MLLRMHGNYTKSLPPAPSVISRQKTGNLIIQAFASRGGINVARSAVFCLGLALFSGFTTLAHAADATGQLPLKAPYDWAGLYVGGHVGYSRGRVRNMLFDPDPARSSDRFGSLSGGLQIGYNYLLPSRFLLGVERDISFPNFLEDGFIAGRATAAQTAVTDQIDYIATLRGRFGYRRLREASNDLSTPFPSPLCTTQVCHEGMLSI